MATKSKKETRAASSPMSVLARTDDGTIQVTLTIPHELVQTKKEDALRALTEKLDIPGFRKGKAPRDIAQKRIDKQDLYNEMLSRLLPDVYADSVQEHNLRPILAPRFEILSISDDDAWTVRAVTCELPTVEIGDYKKAVKEELQLKKIWTPTNGDETREKEETQEDKEQKVLDAIIKSAKAQIPQVLVEEEVNHKLSKLVDQTQRLGLTVEQYLASTGKTIEGLRAEIAQQAQESIKLELALNQIADVENVTVEEAEVDQLVKASGGNKTEHVNPQQKAMISGVLKRRKALDRLIGLS